MIEQSAMEKPTALKNLINKKTVDKISKEIQQYYPNFNHKDFKKVTDQLQNLEFRGRALAIADSLQKHLPADYRLAYRILKKLITSDKVSGFELWPVSEFISAKGLNHLTESMDLMYELTQRFTSEFAVRAFFQNEPETVLEHFHKFTTDKNVHIRRWVSEGTRPYLPWGLRLAYFVKYPEKSISLLDKLKFDDELYVRKSVANHLNDISKFNPELVISTLLKWKKSAPKTEIQKIDWIIKHALRTLIKKGHSQALAVMGVTDSKKIKIQSFELDKKNLKIGDHLVFNVHLKSVAKTEQKIIVDYVIFFKKKNGSLSSKVFKLKTFNLSKNQDIILTKRHHLKKITTMTFYPGKHYLCLRVNGKDCQKIEWILKG